MVRRRAPLQFAPMRRRARVSNFIRRRKPKRNDLKKYAKKAAFGTGLGLAVSIPLTFAAKQFNMPQLMEAGQRGGAIAASAVGGTAGQIGYQVVDAIADRFIFAQGGRGLTGTNEVYL